jgi:hypothetical protein
MGHAKLRMLKDPRYDKLVRWGFMRVVQMIDARAMRKRKKERPAMYEVWHEIDVARATYLETLEAGGCVSDARIAAMQRIKLI